MSELYQNFRDYLASRYPNTGEVKILICAPPINLDEADFPREGSTRLLWHQILAKLDQTPAWQFLIDATVNQFKHQESIIRDLATRWLPSAFQPPPPINMKNPYRGLNPFGEDDYEYFFGREAPIHDLEERLKETPFLTLYGASGSGKSSLLSAGLKHRWKCSAAQEAILFTPDANPFDSLRLVGLRDKPNAAQPLMDQARAGQLPDLFSQLQKKLWPRKKLLVIVDQGEQLFTRTDPTLGQDLSSLNFDLKRLAEGHRHDLAANFLACLFAPHSDQVRIVVGIRDDFFPTWSQTVPPPYQANYSLRPPAEADWRDIILLPAKAHQVLFQAGLPEEMLAKLAKGEVTLPLLQFYLERLWEHPLPENGVIQEQAANIGHFEGALQAHIRKFLEDHPKDRDNICRLLLLFVRFDEQEGQYRAVSSNCAWQDIPEELRDLARDLMDNFRLLTTRGNEGQIEFVHEIIFKYWPDFDQLTGEHAEMWSLKAEITKAAVAWFKEPNPKRRKRELSDSRFEKALLFAALGLHKGREDRFKSSACELQALDVKFLETCYDRGQVEKREKINRLIVLYFLTFTTVALASLGWISGEKYKIQEEKTILEGKKADASAKQALEAKKEASWNAYQYSYNPHSESNDLREKMAYLAEALRLNKNNQFALKDAMLWLQQMRDINPIPVLGPLRENSCFLDVVFSSDGSRIFTTTQDTARVWETATGKSLHTFTLDAGVKYINFNPNGSMLITSSENVVNVWDIATGRTLHTIRHEDSVKGAIFSPDGTKFAIVTESLNSKDVRVQLWDSGTGRVLCTLTDVGSDFSNAEFSPDSSKIVTVIKYNFPKQGKVQVWDAASGRSLHTLLHKCEEISAAFTPDGTRIITMCKAFIGFGERILTIWDFDDNYLNPELMRFENIHCAFFSPDGSRIITSVENKPEVKVLIYEGNNGEYTIQGQFLQGKTFFSPDGARFITTCDNMVNSWDTVTGKLLFTLRHDSYVTRIAFSPDGTRILTTCADNTVWLWNAATIVNETKPLDMINGMLLSDDPLIKKSVSIPDSTNIVETINQLAGMKISENGTPEDMSIESRVIWRDGFLTQADDGSDLQHIIRWHLDNSRNRTISPLFNITVSQYIEKKIEWVMSHLIKNNGSEIENDWEYSVRISELQKVILEAYRHDPSHPLIYFALAAVENLWHFGGSNLRSRFLINYGMIHLPKDEATQKKAEEIMKLIKKKEEYDSKVERAKSDKEAEHQELRDLYKEEQRERRRNEPPETPLLIVETENKENSVQGEEIKQASQPDSKNKPSKRYPKARPVPGKPGHVYSPYDNKELDVTGIISGTKVMDPKTKKIFRVP